MAVLAVLAVHVLADNGCDIADDHAAMLQNFQMDRTSQGKQAEPGEVRAVFLRDSVCVSRSFSLFRGR